MIVFQANGHFDPLQNRGQRYSMQRQSLRHMFSILSCVCALADLRRDTYRVHDPTQSAIEIHGTGLTSGQVCAVLRVMV
jgi:hypothetical protein